MFRYELNYNKFFKVLIMINTLFSMTMLLWSTVHVDCVTKSVTRFEKSSHLSVINFNERSNFIFHIFCEVRITRRNLNTTYSSLCSTYEGCIEEHLDIFNSSRANLDKYINTFKSKFLKNKQTLNASTDQRLFHKIRKYYRDYENSSFMICADKTWSHLLNTRYSFWNENDSEKCWVLRSTSRNFKVRHKRHEYEDIIQLNDQNEDYENHTVIDGNEVPEINLNLNEQKDMKPENQGEVTTQLAVVPTYYVLAVPKLFNLIGLIVIFILIIIPIYTCCVVLLMYRYTSVVIHE